MRKWIFASVALYFFFLVATAPASFLNGWLEPRFGLTLSDSAGTVWRGSATLSADGARLSALSWTISLPEILQGRLHLAATWDASPLDITLTPSGVILKNFSFDLPARILCRLSPAIAAARPDGILHLAGERFSFPAPYEGSIAVSWQNAASSLSRVTPLGNYALALRGEGEKVILSLSTRSGPLLLSGSGFWQDKNGLHFSARAQTQDENIAGLLRIGGVAEDGAYALRIGQ